MPLIRCLPLGLPGAFLALALSLEVVLASVPPKIIAAEYLSVTSSGFSDTWVSGTHSEGIVQIFCCSWVVHRGKRFLPSQGSESLRLWCPVVDTPTVYLLRFHGDARQSVGKRDCGGKDNQWQPLLWKSCINLS